MLEEAAESRFAELFGAFDTEADPHAVARARSLARRRGDGEPLQRVLGHWSFRTLELEVDGRALVPRPETEVVTGYALEALARRRRAGGELIVVDLGTGSGAIALSIAAEASDAAVIATDRSKAALALAKRNSSLLGSAARRVRFVCGDWYAPFGEALSGRVDVVVANPPYLSAAEWAAAPSVVRDWDPRDALVGGEDGTEGIAAVVSGAPAVLAKGGALVVEIGSGQGPSATALSRAAGAVETEIWPDLAGRDRVLVATW